MKRMPRLALIGTICLVHAQARPFFAQDPVTSVGATGEVAVDFQKLREQQVRRVDSGHSLNLLTSTLATAKSPDTQAALLRGMVIGLDGRQKVAAPDGWQEASARLAKSEHPEVRLLTQQLSQIFGDKAAADKALVTVRDRQASPEDRRSALKSLVTQRHPDLSRVLESLLADSALQVDAIRAYGTLDEDRAPELLLSRYAKLEPMAKRAVIETLATRKNYATALLAALENETVTRSEVPAYIARSLSSLLGESFTKVFGDIEALSKDKAELIAKYQGMLTSEKLAAADPRKGRVVFQTICAACHQLYGEGGVIGPDLTGSNRADLNYILLNMIDPSADIPDAYQLVTIKTKSGQILTGTLAQEDDQRVVLNLIGQKMTVVKSDIASREVAPVSMMPEGLLPTLQDSQVLDLVNYLQTTTQVELPK
ncbi:MAG: c-type cytochrome [Verrucomicrobiae bacterium]|nr:c-type cytochrome [Verrucomicrobiae bacterium]